MKHAGEIECEIKDSIIYYYYYYYYYYKYFVYVGFIAMFHLEELLLSFEANLHRRPLI